LVPIPRYSDWVGLRDDLAKRVVFDIDLLATTFRTINLNPAVGWG
jgi:hypothetical protein